MDSDLAGLVAAGGPFVRGVHRVEVAHIEGATGQRIPRRDRRHWTVRVRQCGAEGVARVIRTGAGRPVAEFIDADVDEPAGGAR